MTDPQHTPEPDPSARLELSGDALREATVELLVETQVLLDAIPLDELIVQAEFDLDLTGIDRAGVLRQLVQDAVFAVLAEQRSA